MCAYNSFIPHKESSTKVFVSLFLGSLRPTWAALGSRLDGVGTQKTGLLFTVDNMDLLTPEERDEFEAGMDEEKLE